MPAGFDEDNLKLALLEGGQERQKAVKTIFKGCKYGVMAFLRQEFATLDSAVLADFVQQAFMALFEECKNGSFDYDGSIFGYLCTVAKHKAVDHLRRHETRLLHDDEFYEEVARRIKDTKSGESWHHAIELQYANEIKKLFRSFISSLPKRQRQVAEIIYLGFPDELPLREIADKINEQLEEPITVVHVKSARNQIRSKFEELLRLKNNIQKKVCSL